MKKNELLELMRKEYETTMWLAKNSCEKNSVTYRIYLKEAATCQHVINLLTDDEYAEQIKKIYKVAETD